MQDPAERVTYIYISVVQPGVNTCRRTPNGISSLFNFSQGIRFYCQRARSADFHIDECTFDHPRLWYIPGIQFCRGHRVLPWYALRGTTVSSRSIEPLMRLIVF